MSKAEFLQELKAALAGEMAPNQVDAHLKYYDRYIIEEMSRGLPQEEVLARLGDPRLIAKTLIDTGAKAQEAHEGESPQKKRPQRRYLWGLDLTTWYGKLLVILGAFAILVLVLTVLSALLPFILIFLLISIAIRYVQQRNERDGKS